MVVLLYNFGMSESEIKIGTNLGEALERAQQINEERTRKKAEEKELRIHDIISEEIFSSEFLKAYFGKDTGKKLEEKNARIENYTTELIELLMGEVDKEDFNLENTAVEFFSDKKAFKLRELFLDFRNKEEKDVNSGSEDSGNLETEGRERKTIKVGKTLEVSQQKDAYKKLLFQLGFQDGDIVQTRPKDEEGEIQYYKVSGNDLIKMGEINKEGVVKKHVGEGEQPAGYEEKDVIEGLKPITEEIRFQFIYNSLVTKYLKENGKGFDKFQDEKEEQERLKKIAWLTFKERYPSEAKKYEEAGKGIVVEESKELEDERNKLLTSLRKLEELGGQKLTSAEKLAKLTTGDVPEEKEQSKDDLTIGDILGRAEKEKILTPDEVDTLLGGLSGTAEQIDLEKEFSEGEIKLIAHYEKQAQHMIEFIKQTVVGYNYRPGHVNNVVAAEIDRYFDSLKNDIEEDGYISGEEKVEKIVKHLEEKMKK